MKRFEFSYRDDQYNMHFITLFDDDILSACERVLFRRVGSEEITGGQPDNFFVTGWEDTLFTIHSSPYEPSTTCVMPLAAKSKVDSILEGLV